MAGQYKVTFFVCDHLRPVARDEKGNWRHLHTFDSGSALTGQLASTCEAGVYKHILGTGDTLEHNYAYKCVS